MSGKTFLDVFMIDGPEFKPLTDKQASYILKNEGNNFEKYNEDIENTSEEDEDFDNNCDVLKDPKYELQRKIVVKYINKELIVFLGRIIIKIYVNQDPSKQTVWVTDSSRIKFYIKKKLMGI